MHVIRIWGCTCYLISCVMLRTWCCRFKIHACIYLLHWLPILVGFIGIWLKHSSDLYIVAGYVWEPRNIVLSQPSHKNTNQYWYHWFYQWLMGRDPRVSPSLKERYFIDWARCLAQICVQYVVHVYLCLYTLRLMHDVTWLSPKRLIEILCPSILG